ncbi:MAG TPA: hypothetical protein VIG40_03300 [Tissierellaceae bacterium]
MNLDFLKNEWEQASKEIQKNWDKLTKEDMQKAKGNLKELKNIIQEKYDLTKDEVDEEVEKFTNNMKSKFKTFGKNLEDDAEILKMEAEDKVEDLKDDAEILKMEAEDKVDETSEKIKRETEEKTKEATEKMKKGIEDIKNKFN